MKFLEDPKLLSLTNTLNGADLGERVVYGRIESYTCKTVKAEKVLSKEIEKKLVVEASTSPGGPNNNAMMMDGSSSGGSAAAPSPLGPLNSASTRKLLVNLITTMNASFPDYDFSSLRPEHFDYEANRYFVQSSINNVLLTGMEHIQSNFRERVWKTIDEVIELDKCEIYSYSPDADSDLGRGKLWNFNYFFFNKKKKTLVLFAANAVSKVRGKFGRHSAGDEDIDAMDENNVDTEADNAFGDWDDPTMDSKQPVVSAFATPAMTPAQANARPTSLPSSPFFGSAMAPAAPPPVQQSHPQQYSLHHSTPHSANGISTAAPSSSSSTLLVMGPATPQQQLLMQQHQQHQQQQQQQQQRTIAQPQQRAAQAMPVPAYPTAHSAGGTLARSLPNSSASIVGRPVSSAAAQTASAMQVTSPTVASPTEVLSKHGRTNSFAAAAALQQSMMAKQQQQRGSFSGSAGPSPGVSPQIRPAQPAGSALVRSQQQQIMLHGGARPTGVALSSPASNGAGAVMSGATSAQQQQQLLQHQRAAAAAHQQQQLQLQQQQQMALRQKAQQQQQAMSQANAIALSQSMGIPLLKPITSTNSLGSSGGGGKPQAAIPLGASAPMHMSMPMSMSMPMPMSRPVVVSQAMKI